MSLLGMQRLWPQSQGRASTTEAWFLALQDSASLDDERQWVMGDTGTPGTGSLGHRCLDPAGTFWSP